MKNLLLSLLLASFSMFLFASNVELQDAKNIAKNAYYQKLNTYLEKVDYDAIEILDYYVIKQEGENVLYAINFTNYGFILIAADDAIEPVLGYDLSNQYSSENQPEGFSGVIWEYGDHIAYLRSNKINASQEISQMWNELENFEYTSFAPKDKSKDIDPLLSCTWDQNSPYNYYCPIRTTQPNSNGKAYVGCVASAICQIMLYWRYPEQGNGSHSYFCYPFGTLSANFGETTYNWDAMVDNSNQKVNHNMALVGYHAGVAVDMDYNHAGGSGAFSSDVPYAMKTYFKYANNVQFLQRQNYPLTSWETYLQLELEDNCPVYYAGQSPDGGHAFVLDGYRESDGFYHFNFGWSGSGNGWFAVTDAGGYTNVQAMVKNIEPNDPTYPYGCTPDYELTNLVGSFEDGSGPQEDYDGSASCSWLINPQTAQDSVTKIKLNFVLLNTDLNDIVTLYDGASTSDPVIGEYSGPDAPTSDIYSTGSQMLIVFEANGDGTTGPGFKIEYDSYQPSWCSGNTVYDEP